MKLKELLESRDVGEYVYHASFLPNLARGLKSIRDRGLIPSKAGYLGPGVYFSYSPTEGFYHVSKDEATLFRAKWKDLEDLFGSYPQSINGIQRTEDEIVVPGPVPSDLLEVEYFPGEYWGISSALASEVRHED